MITTHIHPMQSPITSVPLIIDNQFGVISVLTLVFFYKLVSVLIPSHIKLRQIFIAQDLLSLSFSFSPFKQAQKFADI